MSTCTLHKPWCQECAECDECAREAPKLRERLAELERERERQRPIVQVDGRERGLVGVYVFGDLVWEGERQADAHFLKMKLDQVFARIWPASEAEP